MLLLNNESSLPPINMIICTIQIGTMSLPLLEVSYSQQEIERSWEEICPDPSEEKYWNAIWAFFLTFFNFHSSIKSVSRQTYPPHPYFIQVLELITNYQFLPLIVCFNFFSSRIRDFAVISTRASFTKRRLIVEEY